VLERDDGAVVGQIEVKASATVTEHDFGGGLRPASLVPAVTGLKLRGWWSYDGETSVPFGERLFAAPISTLWS